MKTSFTKQTIALAVVAGSMLMTQGAYADDW